MGISYKDTNGFQPEELQDLFLSVNWQSGQYPEKLTIAMAHSACVFSAWDSGKLIGLIMLWMIA